MRIYKNILFFLAIPLLALPLAIEFELIPSHYPPLVGAFPKHEMLPFSVEKVKSKEWQESVEQGLKSNLKIKPAAVRLQHQLDYELFNKLHMADILQGKNDYLFNKEWAKSRCCQNKLNPDSLDHFASQLKRLQTVMAAKGKFLKIIIPPSKEEIFHAQLPDAYSHEYAQNDYHMYTQALTKHGVQYDDLLPYYTLLMDTASYPVYSKTSVHWTMYGAHFTLLNLAAEMDAFFGHRMAKLTRTNLKLRSFNTGESDGDLEQTLNLLYKIDEQDFAHPQYHVDSTHSPIFKPKVFTIGDSYYWAMKGSWMLPFLYHPDSRYLYYYSAGYSVGNQPEIPVIDLDIAKEFASLDAIVLINSSHNLDGFPFGMQRDMDKIIQAFQALPDQHKIQP